MCSHDRRLGLDSSRAKAVQPFRHLTDEELLDRCRTLGVKLSLPFSQIEAEAVHRGVSVEALLRDYLVWKLKEANDA